MSGGRQRPALRPALAAAVAGAAFAVGIVALVEALSGLLPPTRGVFATWGPVATVAALLAALLAGLPSALLVEVGTTLLGRRTPGATAVGYALAAAVWAVVLVLVWRASVDPGASVATLAGELAAIAAGGVLLWSGARLAERRPPGVAGVLGFAVAALVALAVATAVARW
ncbi:MAG: hypothetical protein ACQETV_02810 [Actinomycetota bacterium]